MTYRKLPFGYEMHRGNVQVNAKEAGVVRKIYAAYAGGASYRQLTEWLNAQPMRYSAEDKPWNKNMVARILTNDTYTGTNGYPAVLSVEERHRATSAKPATAAPSESSQAVKAVRRLARCANCGSTLTLSSNRFGWARWNCPACAAITEEAVTPAIMNSLICILTTVREAPEWVLSAPEPVPQEGLAQAERRFGEMLDSPEFDEDTAKAAALALASAKFDALGSEDYETMRIRYTLDRAEYGDELDAELLYQITKAILIHPSGAVSLQLKNGQIIERNTSK